MLSTYRPITVPTLSSSFTVGDLNNALAQIQQSLQFLSNVMTVAREGSALLGFNIAIDPAIQVGQPVYYNVANSRLELAQVEVTEANGYLSAAVKSDVIGIVTVKCASDKAHILLDGICSIDLTASTGSATPNGKFYLSRDPGKLISTVDQQVVSPVLVAFGDGSVLFRPWFADNFARYIPKLISISALPAGTASSSSGITTISSTNTTTAGWLPASHSVFNGLRPSGAEFGYHWQVDANLKDIWPPLAPAESRLHIDPGTENSRGYSTVLSGDSNRLLIDANGIWWMTRTTGQLPWDMPLDLTNPSNGVPIDYARRLRFEGQFAGEYTSGNQSVHSLISEVPWLKFYGLSTQTVASRGDLSLRLVPSEWITSDPPDMTGTAIKRLVDAKFTSGPVITGIKSLSPSATLSGTDIGDGYVSGLVGLTVVPVKDFDVLPLRIKLTNVTDEAYSDVMALGMPGGSNSSFIVEYHIPKAIPANSQVKFIFWLLAPQQIAIPAGMTVQSRRMLAATGTAQSLPVFTDLTFTYPSGSTLAAGKYIAAETAALDVSGGDTIFIKVARAGATDGVAGRIDVLKAVGQFV